MIRAKIIPKLLEQIHVDGVETSLLMKDDGSLLGAAGYLASKQNKDARIVSAILSNVWADYEAAGARIGKPSGSLQFLEIKLEKGRFFIMRISGQYVAAASGTNPITETARTQLERLRDSLEPVLKSFDMQAEDDT